MQTVRLAVYLTDLKILDRENYSKKDKAAWVKKDSCTDSFRGFRTYKNANS